jgi:hypothetical protein
MCSVSFIPHPRGFYIGMNRDESVRRAAASPPGVFPLRRRTALLPYEPGGGSWVAVNDAALALTLINWYEVEFRRDGAPAAANTGAVGGARTPPVSRGIVVPALMDASGVDEARARLATLPLQNLAAFRLIVFAGRERTVREFRWDRRALDVLPHAWRPAHWFSSGYDEPRARIERENVARRARSSRDAGSLRWLRDLHASHDPARGPFCFCMHRDGYETVSYTEISVTPRNVTMRYHGGPPCCVPGPVAREVLRRSAA